MNRLTYILMRVVTLKGIVCNAKSSSNCKCPYMFKGFACRRIHEYSRTFPDTCSPTRVSCLCNVEFSCVCHVWPRWAITFHSTHRTWQHNHWFNFNQTKVNRALRLQYLKCVFKNVLPVPLAVLGLNPIPSSLHRWASPFRPYLVYAFFLTAPACNCCGIRCASPTCKNHFLKVKESIGSTVIIF